VVAQATIKKSAVIAQDNSALFLKKKSIPKASKGMHKPLATLNKVVKAACVCDSRESVTSIYESNAVSATPIVLMAILWKKIAASWITLKRFPTTCPSIELTNGNRKLRSESDSTKLIIHIKNECFIKSVISVFVGNGLHDLTVVFLYNAGNIKSAMMLVAQLAIIFVVNKKETMVNEG
jgi:hypothetical protein